MTINQGWPHLKDKLLLQVTVVYSEYIVHTSNTIHSSSSENINELISIL